MAKTKTKIPAGLQVFTDSITTEQLKQVEEAIKEQNAAIDNLSKRLEDTVSSINKQRPQPHEGLSKEELGIAVDQYVSDFTGKFEDIIRNYLASFRGEVTVLRNERKAEHQELIDQRAHQHKVFIRIVIAIPIAALLIFFHLAIFIIEIVPSIGETGHIMLPKLQERPIPDDIISMCRTISQTV